MEENQNGKHDNNRIPDMRCSKPVLQTMCSTATAVWNILHIFQEIDRGGDDIQ